MSLPAFFSRLLLSFFLLAGAFFFLAPHATHAQTTSAPAFYQPNVDTNVEQNQHTWVQATMIEVMATLVCQLAGIDPINPNQPCLGINPTTNKIGYVPAPKDGPQIGGVLGMSTQMIGMMYIPPANTSDYTQYMASNFGIVKPVYAADGFTALRPLLQMWVGTRNISYSFLILIFVLIGIGIMLRFRIDPRTVMAFQNQIPKVVVALVLITGSYAIAGLMVDGMWTVTYAGINMITSSGSTNGGSAQLTSNPVVDGKSGDRLSKVASNELITTPLAYVGRIFQRDIDGLPADGLSDNGIYWIAFYVSQATGGIVQDAVRSIIPEPNDDCNPWKYLIPVIGPILGGATEGQDCAAVLADAIMAPLIGFFVNIITLIIVIVALLVVLFRVWWMLLKAYISVLIFIVLAPGFIVLKLIPNGPFGIEYWLRHMFANLIVFPIVVWDIVAARVFMDAFRSQDQGGFVPPLIGNQNMDSFGILVAFGFIMILPTVVDTVRKAMKAQSNPQISATILAGIAAGGRAPSELGKRFLKRQFRHEDRTRGLQEGPMREWLKGQRNAPAATNSRASRARAGFRHVRARVYDIVVRPLPSNGTGGTGH